jgi:hypothetical protein
MAPIRGTKVIMRQSLPSLCKPTGHYRTARDMTIDRNVLCRSGGDDPPELPRG